MKRILTLIFVCVLTIMLTASSTHAFAVSGKGNFKTYSFDNTSSLSDTTNSINNEDEFPLQKGSRGNKVKEVQQLLNDLGYLNGGIDGIFGNGTQGAIVAFQYEKNISITGIVDKQTYEMLLLSIQTQIESSKYAFLNEMTHEDLVALREELNKRLGVETQIDVQGTDGSTSIYDQEDATTDSKLKTFAMHEDGKFRFTPNEFEERFEKISGIFAKSYGGNNVTTLMAPLENGELCLALYDENYDMIAYIQFTDEKQYLNETEQDEADISCVMGFLISEDATSWIDVMIPVFITCDSSLEVSDASDLCKSMLLSSATGKPHVHNEIGYAFAPVGDAHMFTISLLID